MKWFKGQALIEPSEKYKIKREQYSAELKIMKVKPEDAGVYKCRAGIAETEATLSVEGTERFEAEGDFRHLALAAGSGLVVSLL